MSEPGCELAEQATGNNGANLRQTVQSSPYGLVLLDLRHAALQAAGINLKIEVVDESGRTILVVPVGHAAGTELNADCRSRPCEVRSMVGEHPNQATRPNEDLKPAWRDACVAYRKVRQSGELDQPARLAARAAIQQLRTNFDSEEASRQASAAIHYASVFHTEGLWHRVGDPKFWK